MLFAVEAEAVLQHLVGGGQFGGIRRGRVGSRSVASTGVEHGVECPVRIAGLTGRSQTGNALCIEQVERPQGELGIGQPPVIERSQSRERGRAIEGFQAGQIGSGQRRPCGGVGGGRRGGTEHGQDDDGSVDHG
ncbi:MAG: hypothetical protein MUF25_18410 [Pirellulaceae bacterium]|nr:hypothetical protein [Pirellulaceae bacterium]